MAKLGQTVEYLPHHVSTIETVDGAFWDHIQDMNIHVVGNKGWKKIPIIWASAERAYQTKHNKDLSDADGTLILPILSIERTAVEKSLSKKGSFFGNVPSVTVARQINQGKTGDFENAISRYQTNFLTHQGQDNSPRPPKKTVYKYASIPVPVYLYITYSVVIRTQYQQQMNQALAPFWTDTGGINYFTIAKDGHRFEAFIAESFGHQNNFSSMGTDERTIETKFDINVLGYVIGADANQDTPNVEIRESIVDVAYTSERAIFGDIPETMSQADWHAYCQNLNGNRQSEKVENPGTGKYIDDPGLQLPCEDILDGG